MTILATRSIDGRPHGRSNAIVTDTESRKGRPSLALLPFRKTVAEAMYEARDTEKGDLFIDGSGLLTFHDRKTI